MSKLISVVIFFLVLLFQFPSLTRALISIPSSTGAIIQDFGELLVGESKPVKVTGLTINGLYYWIETNSANIPTFIGCIRADGSGVINETIGPYSKAGTYHLAVTLATSTSVEGRGSNLPPPNCDPEVPTNPVEADFYVVLYSGITVAQNPTPVKTDSGTVTFTVSTTSDISTSQDFSYNTWRDGTGRDSCSESTGAVKPIDPRTIKITNTITGCRAEVGNWHLEVWQGAGTAARSDNTLIVRDYGFSVEQGSGTGGLQSCNMKTDPDPLLFTTSPSAKFIVDVGDNNAFPSWKMEFECGTLHNIDFATKVGNAEIYRELNNHDIGGIHQGCEFQLDCGQTETVKKIKVIGISGTQSTDKCEASYTVKDPSLLYGTCTANYDILAGNHTVKDNNCTNGATPYITKRIPDVCNSDLTPIQCVCMPPGWSGSTTTPSTTPSKTCKDPNDPTFDPNINIACATAGGDQCSVDGSPGFKTAIGCIPTNPDKLVQAVLTFVIGISGGLAFLLMLLGAFQMLTSAGNPETLNAGKDRFTQAIIGLLFVIFSVLLLQIIGVDILGLEGFRR